MEEMDLKLALPGVFGDQPVPISVRGPITWLIGPNGSGKSQVLRRLKIELQNRVGNCLLLSAGRLQPLEVGRLVVHPGIPDPKDVPSITLQDGFRPNWFKLETVQGVLNRLAERTDIQIKVAERLRCLFDRELVLSWERGNLHVSFLRSGISYPSSKEASGLLHLVAILSALYDDGIKVVLLDEPEVSLHPQLQAFLLREIEKAAGDPSKGKKLVVIATHSPTMVRLRRLADLPSMVFFKSIDASPVQVDPGEGALKNQKLEALVRMLGSAQREALFSLRPLLVEGPSDELVIDALDAAAQTNLYAAGSQILPVTGVTRMAPVTKLLRLMGKGPSVLADLDAFTDDLDLVNVLNDVPEGLVASQEAGHANLYDASKRVHDSLSNLSENRWKEVEPLLVQTSYEWKKTDATEAQLRRRRLAATVLSLDEVALAEWPDGNAAWIPLKRQLHAALNLLESAGCFIQRGGAMEDAYRTKGRVADKMAAASEEVEAITAAPNEAFERHVVSLRALRHVSRTPAIDESAAVAKAFVAVVSPAIDGLMRNPSLTTKELGSLSALHARESASLFNIEKKSKGDRPIIEVGLKASVLDVQGFPIVLEVDDNVNAVAIKI